ncbi:MAG: aminopeptidase [Deltaproteobacteria bacterium]|jgi:aspartyl aminopeptidase|nr:aminopeptidase [Deltaproteobacteria bacterium]
MSTIPPKTLNPRSKTANHSASVAKKAASKKNSPPKDKAPEDYRPTIWENMTPSQKTEVESLAQEYRQFLTEAKTERTTLAKVLSWAKDAGLTDLAKSGPAPGGGYLVHHGKLLGLAIPGAKNDEGFNLIVTHGDAPRLDLKPRCLYESGGLGFFKSNLYGGLKKFQWLARPLAMWGFCVLKDGREVTFRYGEDENDPVLTITDLLPHLDSRVQRDKKLVDAFPAERLNALLASRPFGQPNDKNRLKKTVTDFLLSRWGLTEDDLISSEIELVPAGPAKEVGLDASLIGGYGQDDRLSTFVAAKAILEVKKPAKPLLLIVFDREEIGSYGSTGAETNFITRLAAAALTKTAKGTDWLTMTETLAKSQAISADVEAAFDPTFKEVHDELNAARLGYGPCLTRYTGGAGKYGASEARAEYMAKIRRVFDEAQIAWQSSLLGKQEYGGGGTVALSLAYHGVSVVDCGAPLLSMHSPFEIASKADLWMAKKALKAFLSNA